MEERINSTFSREMRNLSLKQSDENYKKRHNLWFKEQIAEKRNTDYYFLSEMSTDDKFSLATSEDDNQIEFINMLNINESLIFLFEKNYSDKSKTKTILKIFRKEISKNSMNCEITKQILSNENLLIILANFLFDFKNSEIQLETLWILNNLCIFCHKFQFKYQFYEIHKLLINFMISESNFSNSGTKNLIFEKFFSLIGNLILYEENLFHFYISNKILSYLIKNLNSSVRSLRTVCIWTINNILSAVNSCTDNEIENTRIIIFNNLFNDKDKIYYFKFLFTRVDPSKNFDECYEFLWLLNSLCIQNWQQFTILILKDGELILENIQKLLYFLIIDKLHQPVIRVIGNLVAYNIENVSHELVKIIFNDKNVISFLLNFLKKYLITYETSYKQNKLSNYSFADSTRIEDQQNFYFSDFYLIKDILWFLNNLACYEILKIENYYSVELMNFLENIWNNISVFPIERYLNNQTLLNELTKNIFSIFYKIHAHNNFINFRKSNDNLFKTNTRLLNFIIKYKDNLNFDYSVRLIVIDFIVCYVKINQSGTISVDLMDHLQLISQNKL